MSCDEQRDLRFNEVVVLKERNPTLGSEFDLEIPVDRFEDAMTAEEERTREQRVQQESDREQRIGQNECYFDLEAAILQMEKTATSKDECDELPEAYHYLVNNHFDVEILPDFSTDVIATPTDDTGPEWNCSIFLLDHKTVPCCTGKRHPVIKKYIPAVTIAETPLPDEMPMMFVPKSLTINMNNIMNSGCEHDEEIEADFISADEVIKTPESYCLSLDQQVNTSTEWPLNFSGNPTRKDPSSLDNNIKEVDDKLSQLTPPICINYIINTNYEHDEEIAADSVSADEVIVTPEEWQLNPIKDFEMNSLIETSLFYDQRYCVSQTELPSDLRIGSKITARESPNSSWKTQAVETIIINTQSIIINGLLWFEVILLRPEKDTIFRKPVSVSNSHINLSDAFDLEIPADRFEEIMN